MTTAEDVEREMTTEREEWEWNERGQLVVDNHVAATMEADMSPDVALRIAAVPDMEAALMRLLSCEAGIEASNWGGEDVLEEARAALRKAGLL